MHLYKNALYHSNAGEGRVLRKILIGVLVLLTVSHASAIDINSSKALQYYGDGSVLDFEVETSGDALLSGNLSVGSNNINDLADPEVATDAANKRYVDQSDDTISDDQNLKEVLVNGNVANQSIDMNGNTIYQPSQLETGGQTIEIRDSTGDIDIIRFKEGGIVEIPNGNLNIAGNSITNIGSANLGWTNLTNYPSGCASDEAVRVIGDSLDCVSLNPGGTVETSGASKGEVAYFIDSENVSGSNNFYWNNSEVRLGLGTSNPTATLDVMGEINLNNNALTGVDWANSDDGDGSNLDADLLDGVELANINWGDTAMSQSNVSVSDLGNADSNLNMNGYEVQNVVSNSAGDAVNRSYVLGQTSDSQDLSANNGTTPTDASSVTQEIQITGGSNTVIKDYYVPDTQNNVLKDLVAGDGLSGTTNDVLPGSDGDVTLSHGDTSSQANVSQSGGNVIQGIDVDGAGHTTTIRSTDLDSRYYTESESDTNFVDVGGDTMTGQLTIDGGSSALTLKPGSSSDHVFMEYYADSDNPNTRSGYIGYSSGGSTALRVKNEMSGDLQLEASSGNVEVSSGNLDLSSASIVNYFDSDACPSGEVVADVQDDGTFICQSITDAASDQFVDESGDTMTGSLNMTGDDIKNVGTLNASLLQQNGNNVESLFVDESGDSMSGDLNMQGNHIDNMNYADFNSQGEIKTDGVDAMRIDSNQNVAFPNGELHVTDGGKAAGSSLIQVGDDVYLSDVDQSNTLGVQGESDSSVASLELGSSGGTVKGDSSGNIEISSGNLEVPSGNLDVSSPSNTGDTVDVGGDVQADGDVKTHSGNVGSDTRMCIGDRCA